MKYKSWFEKNKALFYNSYNVDATNLSIIPPSSPTITLDNEPRSPSQSPVSWGRVRAQFNNFTSAKEIALNESAMVEHQKFIALWTKHAQRP